YARQTIELTAGQHDARSRGGERLGHGGADAAGGAGDHRDLSGEIQEIMGVSHGRRRYPRTNLRGAAYTGGTVRQRKIFFVKYYDKGSTVMGADQISEALQARGVDAQSVYPADVESVRDAILIFIKTSKIHHLLGARRRGNKTVLDIQDTVVFKRRIKNRWLFDGLIFKNQRQLQDFAAPRAVNRVIYHQWDPRYRENELGDREFKIGYFGLQRSFPYF